MNNNIFKYIDARGKYSPKMSENRRIELENSGNDSAKSQLKSLNYTDIWNRIRDEYVQTILRR